jgi:hypothetical protein
VLPTTVIEPARKSRREMGMGAPEGTRNVAVLVHRRT